MGMTKEHLPPHSLEAEQSVLGALLCDRETIISLSSQLQPSDFYRAEHRHIFTAALTMYRRREPIDLLLITEELKRTGTLEAASGEAYLAELIVSTPTAVHADYYAAIVKEHSTRRKIIEHGERIISMAWDKHINLDDVLAGTDAKLRDILQARGGDGFRSFAEIANDVYAELDYDRNPPLKLGFPALDSLTGGLQRTEMMVVAAAPRTGKTSFAMQTAQQIAGQGIPVAIVSLETKDTKLFRRTLGMTTGVNMHEFRDGNIDRSSSSSLERVMTGLGRLEALPIYIHDSLSGDVHDVVARVHALVAIHNIQVVIVDYIQLMHVSGSKGQTRDQAIGVITRSLKLMAMQLDIAVIGLAQINRAGQQADRPSLWHLRDSGNIEQDADIVMFIWQPYPKDAPERVMWTIEKHRDGPTGDVPMQFDAAHTRFTTYLP